MTQLFSRRGRGDEQWGWLVVSLNPEQMLGRGKTSPLVIDPTVCSRSKLSPVFSKTAQEVNRTRDTFFTRCSTVLWSWILIRNLPLFCSSRAVSRLASESVFLSCFETQPKDNRGNVTRSCECCHQLAMFLPQAEPRSPASCPSQGGGCFFESWLQPNIHFFFGTNL